MTSSQRRLRLVIRDDEKCASNLFARLSPGVAQDLLTMSSIVNKNHKNSATSGITDEDLTWRLDTSEGTDLKISDNHAPFLPLCIKVDGKHDHSEGYEEVTIYASYNGGTCDGTKNGTGVIELPGSMLSSLLGRRSCANSLNIPDYVSVSVLSRVRHATRVLVEPLATEDWELLEIHGEAMEQGGLLRQVSLVYPKQTLTLHVGREGRDRVHVVIQEALGAGVYGDDIGLCAREPSSSLWPALVNGRQSAIYDDDTEAPCVVLVEDTEVIVAPKPRRVNKAVSWSAPLRLIPTQLDCSEGILVKLSSTSSRSSEYRPLVVDAGCILLNDDDWTFQCQWARIRPESKSIAKAEVIARVVKTTGVPVGDAALYLFCRLDICSRLFHDFVRLSPVTPKEISPGRLVLRRVQIQCTQEAASQWNVPDISLAFPNWLSKRSDFAKNLDQANVPVGVVVSRSWIVERCNKSPEASASKEQWFRISHDDSSQDPHSHLQSTVCLDEKDVARLWATHTENDNAKCEILVEPSPDIGLIRGPVGAWLSPEWMKPILADLEVFGPSAVSLSGQPGSGKTHNAVLLGALTSLRLRRPLFYLDCKKLQKYKPKMVGILGEIDALFRNAAYSGDSIVILDDLDRLSPNLFGEDGAETSSKMHGVNPMAVDQSKLIADRLSQLFDATTDGVSSWTGKKLSIIVTSCSMESLNCNVFRSSSFIVKAAKIPSLSAAERIGVFKVMLQLQQLVDGIEFDASSFSPRTDGYLARDLEKLSLRMLRIHNECGLGKSLSDVLTMSLADFTPLTQMAASSQESSLDYHWSDIGGLFEAKEKLQATVHHPVVYRRIYEQAQARLPRGILLYGPPGCGKSYLVPALARACNYPLITCKGPEILDKYVGASEAKVRELFEKATQMAPSILFLDELDALAPRRGSDSTGVTDRVVNQLLTFLDGVEDVASAPVYIIGATSRPDKVDPALIRPGRLERHLYIGPPESDVEWRDLLLKVSKNWILSRDCLHSLAISDALLNEIKQIPRLCPADIRAAFDTAHLNAVHRALQATPANQVEKIVLITEDIHFGLRETRPSLNESEAQLLDLIYKPFRGLAAGFRNGSTQNLKTTLR